ncbi:hypothetical protein DK26_01130 [Bosea sp. WAO]|uniref:hypothetical protein n=1 Tax=Bosea sp. WAO TaxID=406341 RepID=UPI0007471138|nr:hypothetical protein [Bosea sp. WAO]KUL97307.1 hypothetical protein DK26_01130 [Bosea sp. WAO]
MTELDKEQAIAFAEKELRDVEMQLLGLARKKAGIVHYLEILRDNGATGAPDNEDASDPADATARQRNNRWIKEAVNIILREGQPMAAPEIHKVHPNRGTVSNALLYRLMYNRAASGKLLNLDSFFWPADVAIPDGWKMPDLNDPNRVRPGRKPGANKKGKAI